MVRKGVIILVVILSMAISGCHRTYDTGVYRTGRAWNFGVYFFDAQNHLTDSCAIKLTIGKGGWLSYIMDQRELVYTYGNCCGKDLKETTGVDERPNMVFIHPPRLACMAFTEIPPMPQIGLPVNMTEVSTGELRIVKGWGSLNGKTIKQKEKLVKMVEFTFADTTISSVMIEGENTNYIDTLGVYKSQYLFNEHFGFTQLNYYKPNGESVKMILKTTNFR